MLLEWLFWCPTKANYSILHAFKFRSPRVEQAYQLHSNGARVIVAAAYFTFSCLLTTVNCSSFSGSDKLPTPFWCFLAANLLQAMALLTLYFSRMTREGVLLLHATVVLLSTLVLSYLSLALAETWLTGSVLMLRKEFPSSLVEEVVGVLTVVYNNQARTTMAFGCQIHLISLSFMGFNCTTIPIWMSFFASFVAITILAPHGGPINVVLSACEMFLVIAPFLILCICIEVLQRRNFQAQQELKRELEISQMAEGMLNNAVKNVLADAAANVQEFLNAGCHTSYSLLQETLTGLARGIRSCRQRQAFLALVSENYEPRFLQVNLRDFGEELVAGRAVAGDFMDCQVLLDPLLCSLVLENAIAQAFQHGLPERPDVRVRAFLLNTFEAISLAVRRTVEAAFEVSFVCKEGEVEIRNGGESIQLGSTSPPAHYMTQHHLKLAAEAHKMAVRWLKQENRIVFRATCMVETIESQGPEPSMSTCPIHDVFPPGLNFYIIDDSVAARRLLASCITHMAAPAAVHCYGTYPEDVHQFVGAASQDADIVICDQHLDYSDQHYLGSDLIRSLRDRGFQGLMCMRSSDMSEQDRELYRACGAHCMFGKEELTREVVHGIKAAYVELKALDQLDGMSLSPFNVSHDSNITCGYPQPAPSSSTVLGWNSIEHFPSNHSGELNPLSWTPPTHLPP